MHKLRKINKEKEREGGRERERESSRHTTMKYSKSIFSAVMDQGAGLEVLQVYETL